MLVVGLAVKARKGAGKITVNQDEKICFQSGNGFLGAGFHPTALAPSPTIRPKTAFHTRPGLNQGERISSTLIVASVDHTQ
jgi:hypothetical protein